MTVPEISIIVPVFNASKTLNRCVESILRQTFPHWELLLVDDGSEDDSLRLCKDFSASDSRIKVFGQNHRGVSAARNLAISHAKGNYFCVVDADDIIEPDYLYELMRPKDYDVIVCGYFVDLYDINGKLVKQEKHLPIHYDIHSFDFREKVWPLFMSGMIHCNWNKRFNTTIVRKSCLAYPDVPVNEDYLFMLDYLSHCRSIVTIAKPLYHWIRVEGTKTGVNSMPDNLLEIYNLAQMKTRSFFEDNQAADVTQYYSYCFLVQKYFAAYREGSMTAKELSQRLAAFHQNKWVKAAFQAYHPRSKGEWLMHTLLKKGWFHAHQWLNKLLSLCRN